MTILTERDHGNINSRGIAQKGPKQRKPHVQPQDQPNHSLITCPTKASMGPKEDNTNRQEDSHIRKLNQCLCIIK